MRHRKEHSTLTSGAIYSPDEHFTSADESTAGSCCGTSGDNVINEDDFPAFRNGRLEKEIERQLAKAADAL